MPLGPFLLALAGAMVSRVLLSLGFAVVTIVGVDVAVGALKNGVVAGMGGLPVDVLNLILLAGGGVALNAIFGAVTFRISYWAITRSVRVLGIKA